MKYTYAYKTSDGVRHEAAIEAASRDAAFAALRGQGIKAIKVVAADGSKANGEIHGVRKRVVAAVAVVVAILVGVTSFFLGESNNQTTKQSNNSLNAAVAQLMDSTRRQVIGDAAIIEKGIRTGWADVFAHEGDRFLASFAIPGVKAGVRNTSIKALEEVLAVGKGSLSQPRDRSLGIEAQQIKAMVEGMKDETRRYIAAGGSIVEYGKRLTERQDAEIAVYKRAEMEIRSARKTMTEEEFLTLYEQRNDELRNLGIRPVTLDD